MRNLTFTGFRDKFDTAGYIIEQSWDWWCEVFSQHETRGTPADSSNKEALDKAKDGEAVVLGIIPKGRSRAKANVTEIHALGLDLENLTDEQINDVLTKLEKWEWFAYTTHKNGAACVGGQTRLRVIIPLARPLPAAQHPEAWARLNAYTGGVTDQTTKDASRLFFCPSTFNPAHAWNLRCLGERWLDPTTELPAVAFDAPTTAAPEASDDVSDERTLRGWIKKAKHSSVITDQGITIADIAKAIDAGASYAAPGERHAINLAITLWLAKRLPRQVSLPAFAAVFGPSLQAMAQESASDDTTPEAVYRMYADATTKAGTFDEAKTQRAVEAQLAHTDAEPYSERDLEAIASKQGWNVRDLARRWVIQKASNYWFLAWPGVYVGPYDQNEARAAAVQHLARAAGQLLLNEPTEKGVRRRRIDELVEEYGTIATEVVADMTAQFGRFDAETKKIHEAVCPRREIQPEYNEEIEGWLRLLGGKEAEKLLDWVACAPDVSKIVCAVYLGGANGGGKTLLAHGLAKLWHTGGPTELERVLFDFNEELSRCPLALADEELPAIRGQSITAKLRSIIGTIDRTLSRKYRAPAILHGAPRVMMTANNPFMLSTKGVSTRYDWQAVAERFLYVETPDEAAELMGLLPKSVKESWGANGIAAYSLWLNKNREVTPGKRFWVEGSAGEMHRILMTSSEWNALICEWLVRYLMNPTPINNSVKALVRCDRGRLLVNDQAVIDTWQQVFPGTRREADTAKIGAALRAISGKDRPQMRFRGRRVRYRVVDTAALFSWCDEHGIGDPGEMRRTLGIATAEDEADARDLTTDDMSSIVTANVEAT